MLVTKELRITYTSLKEVTVQAQAFAYKTLYIHGFSYLACTVLFGVFSIVLNWRKRGDNQILCILDS